MVTQRRQLSAAALDNRRLCTYVLDERIRYRYSQPVTNLRQRLRVVPPSAHGLQRRRRWRLTVEGVQSSRTQTSLDSFGNLTVDVIVPRVDDAVEFALEVEACADKWACYDTVFDPRYFRHTRLTATDGCITELASGDRAGDSASICARVHRSLAYEWGITGVRTTASEALAGGRGVCQDYAHIMLAVCRSVGACRPVRIRPSNRRGRKPRVGRNPPPTPPSAGRVDRGGLGSHPQPEDELRLPSGGGRTRLRRRGTPVGYLRRSWSHQHPCRG